MRVIQKPSAAHHVGTEVDRIFLWVGFALDRAHRPLANQPLTPLADAGIKPGTQAQLQGRNFCWKRQEHGTILALCKRPEFYHDYGIERAPALQVSKDDTLLLQPQSP